MINAVWRSTIPAAYLVCSVASNCSVAGEKEVAKTQSNLEEVKVIGHPLSAEGLAQASVVLAGAELNRKLQGSIGATIALEPGIHSTSFGEAVGRPVIHGQSGARVRVMEDRIDVMDVSVTSGDHATSIEPFIADRVEVLKGASTLLYGSGAIGGVVDVHTGRVPHEVPEKPVMGRAEVRYADNADTSVGAARLDGGIGKVAWHLDGFDRDANDYDIPGFAESARQRASEGEAPETGGQPNEEARGVLPGSNLSTQGGAIGLSFISGWGFAGLAVSRTEANYGLPGSHGHGESNPELNMEQTRIDLEVGVNEPLPGFASLNLRAGSNDYEHAEIEPGGEVGTLFENDAWEARIELVHEPVAGWKGAFGVQLSEREFSAIGEEAFIAPVDSRTMGAFWVGERDFGGFSLESGLRLEHVAHKPSAAALPDTDFDTWSTSLGLVVPLSNEWRATLQADYSSRAPVGEELYSDGPHLATRSFEIGNPALDEESALNLAATLGYSGDSWMLSATFYHIDYSDYIYQFDTGTEVEELPAFQYAQADAAFTGFEAEAEVLVGSWGAAELRVNAMFDTIIAELDVIGNDNPPRLPPSRVGAGLSLSMGSLDASIDYLRVAEQNDTAAAEFPTAAYDDVRAYLGADIGWKGQEITLFVQGSNLTDAEQRNHTSLIKDFAPAPGRTLEIGIRLHF